MPITLEDWKLIEPNLVPECTFTYDDNVPVIVNKNLKAKLLKPGYNQDWDFKKQIKQNNHTLKSLSNFKFPDGTDMITKQTREEQQKQKLLAKFKLIESRHLKTKEPILPSLATILGRNQTITTSHNTYTIWYDDVTNTITGNNT